MPTVSNAVLAEKIDAMVIENGKQHFANVKRLDEIVAQTTLTNGRLRTAESNIAVHAWALGVMGAGALVWLGVWLAKVL